MAATVITIACILILFLIPLASSKKYDMEMEAYRLYEEDLHSVLKRFRRTPEYLKILTEKYKDMVIRLNEITIQTMQHLESKIGKKVAEKMGYSKKNTPTNMPQRLFHAYNARKQNGYDGNGTTVDPVKILDEYAFLRQYNPAQETNQFKELGFQMARQMVQLVIKGMSPIEMTTQPPFGIVTAALTDEEPSKLTKTTSYATKSELELTTFTNKFEAESSVYTSESELESTVSTTESELEPTVSTTESVLESTVSTTESELEPTVSTTESVLESTVSTTTSEAESIILLRAKEKH